MFAEDRNFGEAQAICYRFKDLALIDHPFSFAGLGSSC
jgi:hypothetical protein